jgi:membrane-associated protease RseP (regulator of RpoE activity)
VRAEGFAAFVSDVAIPENGGRRRFGLPRVELLEEGTVEGIVVDAKGEPVPGARVAEGQVPVYLAVGATPPGVAVDDAHGRFRLGELAEGSITIAAYAADRGRGRAEHVPVIAGRTTDAGRVVLEAPDEKSDESAASGGVAVTLGETSEPTEVVVVSVADGSEAERAGLAPNDVIVEIDGASVRSMRAARARLSGPLADDVVIVVHRGSARECFRVPREQVRR